MTKDIISEIRLYLTHFYIQSTPNKITYIIILFNLFNSSHTNDQINSGIDLFCTLSN